MPDYVRITVALDKRVLKRLDEMAEGQGVKRPAMLSIIINERYKNEGYKEVSGDDLP